MKKTQDTNKPFFAKFLEKHEKITKDKKKSVQGGYTQKYPSDGDEEFIIRTR